MSVTMLDISKNEVDVNCPECKAANKVTLLQVAAEETINCSGCTKNIKLNDNNGSMKKAIASVNKSLGDLGDALDG